MGETHALMGIFQSTPSEGRATVLAVADPGNILISIHALRGEGDFKCLFMLSW